MSEGLEAIEHPFEESEVGAVAGRPVRLTVDEALVDEVADEHPGDAEGEAEVGRDLGERRAGSRRA